MNVIRDLLKRTQRICVAIGPNRATAVLAGTRIGVAVDCALDHDSDVEAVSSVLLELKQALSTAAGRLLGRAEVDVALMPPFCESRLVPLPPLRLHEASAVLQRDAARYFVGSNGARALAIELPRRRGNAPQPALAAAASANFVEQIYTAAAAAGWHVRTVVPAISSWMAATARAVGAPRLIAAQCGDVIHVLRIDAAPTQLRRVPLTALEEVRECAGMGPGRVFVWAQEDVRATLENMLKGTGWQVQPSPTGHNDASHIAAYFADNATLELVPDARAQMRGAQQRRLAVRFAIAAVVLLIGSALVDLWGQERELASIREQRAAIRKEVGPLLTLRDSTNTLKDKTKRIDDLRASSSHLTAALVDISSLLPTNAYVTSLHVTGDSLVVEAAGAEAGAALQALRTSEVLRDIRLRGTVDRKMEDGAVTTERFTFTARVVGRASAPTPRPQPGPLKTRTVKGSP